MASEKFFKAVHVSGLELFVWLTNAQVYGAMDSWNEDRVEAYEDRGGEMVSHDVLVSDLDIVEEV